jgi:hypothetical protein
MATLKLEDSDEKRLVLDKCEFNFLSIDVCKFVPKSSMFSKQSYEVRCINGEFLGSKSGLGMGLIYQKCSDFGQQKLPMTDFWVENLILFKFFHSVLGPVA